MAGGYPGAPGGHHGLKHADDHGHFPEEELLGDVGDRSYKLEEHEKNNLKNIEKRIRSGSELTQHELHEYQHYLDHISHHIRHILEEEKGDHIDNIQLERDLRWVAQLMGEISNIMERHH